MAQRAPLPREFFWTFLVVVVLLSYAYRKSSCGPVGLRQLAGRALAVVGISYQQDNAVMKYRSCADAGIGVLLSWYNGDVGLWNNAGWWNSAAAVETIADYSLLAHALIAALSMGEGGAETQALAGPERRVRAVCGDRPGLVGS